MKRCAIFVAWLVALPLASSCAEAVPLKPADAATVAVCDLIGQAARRYRLPPAFFTRLIWQESRFRPNALSPAGAQGIAQFMPLTAAGRGLADPFAVRDALLESAAYLDELRGKFGNLGLAAAAYNAGPGRLSRWLAGQADLPQETRDYVVIVTGHGASDWAAPAPPRLDDTGDVSCATLSARFGTRPMVADAPAPPLKPWAVILVGSPQRGKVLSEYETVKMHFAKIIGPQEPTIIRRRISGAMTPRFIVQLDQDSRAGADRLCKNLLRAGGNCFVLANKF